MKTEDYAKQVNEIRRDYATKSAENEQNKRKEIEHIRNTSDIRNDKLRANSKRNMRNLEEDYKVTLNNMRDGAEQRLHAMNDKFAEARKDMQRDYSEKVAENTLKTGQERQRYNEGVASLKEQHGRELASVENVGKNRLERNKKSFTDEQVKNIKYNEADRRRSLEGAQETIKAKQKLYSKNLEDQRLENSKLRQEDLSRFQNDKVKTQEAFQKSISELEKNHEIQQETKTNVYKKNLKDQHEDYSRKVDQVSKDYSKRFKDVNEKNVTDRKGLINRQRDELERKNKEHIKLQADQRATYKTSLDDLRKAYELKDEYEAANKKRALVRGYNPDQHEKEITHAKQLERVRSEAESAIDKKADLYRDSLYDLQKKSALEKSALKRDNDKNLADKTEIFRQNLEDVNNLKERQLEQADQNKKNMAISLEKSSRQKLEDAHARSGAREEKIYNNFRDLIRKKDRNHELERLAFQKETKDDSNLDVKRLQDHIKEMNRNHDNQLNAASREKERSISGIRIAQEQRINNLTDEFNEQTDRYTERSLDDKARRTRLTEQRIDKINIANNERVAGLKDDKAALYEFAKGDDAGSSAQNRALEDSYGRKIKNYKRALAETSQKFEEERNNLRDDYDQTISDVKKDNRKNMLQQKRDFDQDSLEKSIAADRKIKRRTEAFRNNISALEEQLEGEERKNEEHYKASLNAARQKMQDDLDHLNYHTKKSVTEMKNEFFDERFDIVKNMNFEKYKEKADLKNMMLKEKGRSERSLKATIAAKEDHIIKTEGAKEREVENLRNLMQRNYDEAEERLAETNLMHKLQMQKALDKERSQNETILNNVKENSNKRISELLVQNDRNLRSQENEYETRIRELSRKHRHEMMSYKMDTEKEIARINKANELDKKATAIKHRSKMAKVNDALARRKVIEGKTYA